MMIAITITTAIMPTTAPALKMPAMAEQPLSKVTINRMATGIKFFFIGVQIS